MSTHDQDNATQATPPPAARTIVGCPSCDHPMSPVGAKTVKHLLRYELSRALSEGLFFRCPDPACDVIYLRFAPDGVLRSPAEIFRRADIKERAKPFARGHDRLVCYCFGYTVGDIEDDVRSGAHTIATAIAREVKAGYCACEVMNPGGG